MTTALTNQQLAFHVLEALIQFGVQDFCVCPGSRNSAFVSILENQEQLNTFYFYEERSAAFFALGKARMTRKPVAVIVTSGTAAGELLPAVMEAYYSGVPLILVTADRPRRYRGTGAPQTAEQLGIYGPYVSYSEDLEGDDQIDLTKWNPQFPLHLNVCFEDPNSKMEPSKLNVASEITDVDAFLSTAKSPIVVVSTLKKEERESVVRFLQALNCPVFLEAVSGLREDPRLQHLVMQEEKEIVKKAAESGYFIDTVIRIGGVPTFRLWRDLDEMQDRIKVLSISSLPFKGLVSGALIETDLNHFFEALEVSRKEVIPKEDKAKCLLEKDFEWRKSLEKLFKEEPKASPSLIHALSKKLPKNALIYLGNSMPIREWDLAATMEDKGFQVHASRGLNGIDGQISTFLGLCTDAQDNFAILGDLTTLYDMAGPWILPQMKETPVTLFVINNGGGKIFSRIYKSEIFQNKHDLSFKPLADMWGMEYERLESVPDEMGKSQRSRLIEIVPDNESTDRFYLKLL